MKTLVDAFEHILDQELYVGNIPIDSFRTYLKLKNGQIGDDVIVVMFNNSAGVIGPTSWPVFSVIRKENIQEPFDLDGSIKFLGNYLIGYRIGGIDTILRTPNCVPFQYGQEFKVMYPELLK